MSTKPILLNNIFPVENVGDYKIHFGKWNGDEEPLDAWIREESNWSGWQIYTKNRDDFNRQYIFSLMRFYHEIDIWLFGGIFEVKQENKKWIEDDDWKGYENDVELTDQCAEYIGRLKIYSPYRGRTVRLNFENYYGELEVHEILPEKYSGRVFPGYENVDLSFSELEALVKKDRVDWKTALQSVKGVYMITDTKENKRYVGSAYSEGGVWSRWCNYVASGHGGNQGLAELLGHEADLRYCREHFRLFLLERHPMIAGDDEIIERESFWKKILLSRGDYGYNEN